MQPQNEASPAVAPNEPRSALIVRIKLDGDEGEFNRWYNEKHIPERLAMKGFLSARRYASAETPGEYLAVYELESPEAATSNDYMQAARALETDWDRKVAQTWTLIGRGVWTEISPPQWGSNSVQ
jgi:hypothetical protein